MKLLCLSLISLSLLLFSACRKGGIEVPERQYTGKVVKDVCGHIMVQFTNESVTMGQNGWADPMDSGKVYDRVFKVANPCTWGKKDTVSVFTFRFIAPDNSAFNCANCLAFTSTPDTAYHIQIVK